MKPIASLLAAAAVVACSDAFKPTADNVSGIYQLQTFRTDSAGTTKDWVVGGASLDLILSPGGHASGIWTGSRARIAFQATRHSAPYG